MPLDQPKHIINSYHQCQICDVCDHRLRQEISNEQWVMRDMPQLKIGVATNRGIDNCLRTKRKIVQRTRKVCVELTMKDWLQHENGSCAKWGF